jgi:hypothetical protein
MAPNPINFIGLGTSHGPKPYKFIGFGAMAGTKSYKLIGFGAMAGPKPYKFIGFGAMAGTKPLGCPAEPIPAEGPSAGASGPLDAENQRGPGRPNCAGEAKGEEHFSTPKVADDVHMGF